MRLITLLVMLFIFVRVGHCMMDWWTYDYLTFINRKRFLQIQAQIIEECNRKINSIRDIRFMYEESPHYEIGYVLGECMERYRKMVEIVNKFNLRPDQLFHSVRMLSDQQYYYQEGYNLICMLHEIPRKWGHVEGFETLMEAVDTGDAAKLDETYEEQKIRFDAMDGHRKRLARSKKQRQKQMKKAMAIDELIRQMYGNGDHEMPGNILENLSPERLRKPPKRPIKKPKSVTPEGRLFEYGWELNYEWW